MDFSETIVIYDLKLATDDWSFVVLAFYGPVNNEVMPSRSVNSGTVPGQA